MPRYRSPTVPSSKYITPEGATTLREELDDLWLTQRPKVTRAVSEAAAQGDRSENAEYIYGKKQLREIDKRIRHLRKRLEGMQIIDRAPSDTSKIYFGAWFELEDQDARKKSFRLVGPDEFDSSDNYISMDSPLGKAVMGKAVDDKITVRAPNGEAFYTIVQVSYHSLQRRDDRNFRERKS